MGKKGLALTAIVMAIVLAFTTIRQVPVEATSSTGSEEQGTEQVTENKETDLTVHSSDEDFLAAVAEAKNADPVTDIASVLGYQSEELNAQLTKILATDDIVYFVEGYKIEKDGYTVYPFVITHSDSNDSVWFITDQTQDKEFNAELAIQISCLSEEREDTITYALDGQVASTQEIEPQNLTENEGDPAGGEGDELVPDTRKQCSSDENGDSPEGNTPPDQQDEVASNEDKLGETPDAPTEGDSDGEDNPEDNQGNEGDENQDSDITSQSDELEPGAGALLTRTCLLTTCTVNADATVIKPTINKKAELSDTHSTKGQNDYDITLTVNGDSYTPETNSDPVDVVFVVDASNSMKKAFGTGTRWAQLRSTMSDLIAELLSYNKDTKISVVGYSGAYIRTDDECYQSYHSYNVNDDYELFIKGSSNFESIMSEIPETQGDALNKIYDTVNTNYVGSTNAKAGFVGAWEELQRLSSEESDQRSKYVVYLSDGEPTISKEYRGEYSDNKFQEVDYSKADIISSDGDGLTNQYFEWDYRLGWQRKPLEKAVLFPFILQAKDVANRVKNFPKTTIYSIGIGDSLTADEDGAKYFLNSGFAASYFCAATSEDLKSIFSDLKTKLSPEVTLTSLNATDVLSEYVDLYENQSIKVNGVEIKPTVDPEDENKIIYKQDKTIVACYTIKEKTLHWNVASFLSSNQSATLTYHVHTTEQAIPYDDTYKDKPDCYQGDPQSGTHASDNSEGEDSQYGYRSNVEAYLTYNDESKEGKMFFNHPVVQSTVKGTLTITKTLADTYKGLSKKNMYTLLVTLTSDSINADTYKNMVISASQTVNTIDEPIYSCTCSGAKAGELNLTLKLCADVSITLGNLPVDTNYKVSELLGVSDPYYKISNNGVDFQVSAGNDNVCTIDKSHQTVSGSLAKTQYESSKDIEFYTVYNKDNKVVQYFDSKTNHEITDPELLKKLEEKVGTVSEGSSELRKYVGGYWKVVDLADKIEPTSVNGQKKYLAGKSEEKTIAITKKENTYWNYNGKVLSEKDIKKNYKNASIEKFSDFKFEYQKSKGSVTYMRPCNQENYGWIVPYYVYKDPDGNGTVDSSKVKKTTGETTYYKVKYGDKPNCFYLTQKDKQESYYEFNGNNYNTLDKLEAAIKVENPKVVITRADNSITYYTYETCYETLTDYLIGEKEYHNTIKKPWKATLSHFSTTGANATVKVINTMELRKASIELTKELVDEQGSLKEDATDTNTFVFRFENIGDESPTKGEIFYRAITVSKGSTSNQITIEGIPLGTYVITEQNHMRYQLFDINDSKKVTSLEQELMSEGSCVPVTFRNYKFSDAGFSDSSVIENVGSWKDSVIEFISKIVDGLTATLGN